MIRSGQSVFRISCFRVAFCCVSSLLLLSSAFATHPREIAPGASPLPRGPGLSSAYYGDVGIESNPAVIFADNFEAGDYLTKWDSGNNRSSLSLVNDSASDPVVGNQSLRAGAGSGSFGGSGLIEWFPSAESVFIRFYVKFDELSTGFWHLARIRANKGLTGADKWSSFGQAGIPPDGTNYFTTGVEPISRTATAPLGQWKTYTYYPDMPGQFGHSFPQAVDPPVVEKDQWTSVEFMVKHNTPGVADGAGGFTPGLADGEQAFWIDGELIGHWNKIRWRDSPTLWTNAFVLETYLQDTGAAGVFPYNTALFDNVVIASEYIGPSGLTIPDFLGDFDNDEDVDGADFLAWQRDASVGNLSDWEAGFGTSVGNSAAVGVPEPSVVAMLFLAAAFGGVVIRRR